MCQTYGLKCRSVLSFFKLLVSFCPIKTARCNTDEAGNVSLSPRHPIKVGPSRSHVLESRRDEEEGGELDSHEDLDYHLRVQAR